MSRLKSLPEIRHIRLTGLSPVSLMVIAFAIVTVLTVTVRAWLAPAATTGAPASAKVSLASSTTAAQGNPAQVRIEVERITIRPRGFEPTEITRPAGHFILAVNNRSGLEEVALRLDRVAGSRLREVRVPRTKLDWRSLVDLTPGRYVLTEANHPDWICHITITAR